MKKISDWTIQNKLILVIAPLVIIPLILLAYFATTQLNSALKNGAEKDLDHVVNTIYALCEISLSSENNKPFIPLTQLSKIKKVVKDIIIGETGYPFIIDEKGNLIIHPTKENENILYSQDSKGDYFINEMIYKAISLRGEGTGEIRYPWINKELGEKSPRMKITRFRYLSQLGWVIAAGSYEGEIFGAVGRTQKAVFILTIFTLTLMLALVVFFARFLTEPILELTHLSSRMAEGELSLRVAIHQKDEIGQLALSFNRMAAQIQEHTKNLESLVKQRTQELLESKEKYKRISTLLTNVLESSTEYAIIATDLQWKVLEFNTGARKIFGWEKEEILGEYLYKTYVEKKESFIEWEEFSKLQAGNALEKEVMRKEKNGEVFLSRAVITAMRDMEGDLIGYLEISRDITERKRLEWELIETKDYLESILESSADGIITTNQKGTITYVNRGLEEILHDKKERLIGSHVSLFYLDGIAEARKIMNILRRDQKFTNYEMTMADKSGREIPINTSASLLKNFKGEIIGTVGIFKDMTEKKRLEAALRKAEASLIQSAKMRELGDLVAGVAHEINNPLMASQTLIFRIKEDYQQQKNCSHKKIIEFVDLIGRCNDRIATIVNHLGEFSRGSEMKFEALDIMIPLNNSLLITGQMLLDHQVEVTKDFSGDLPKVMGSASQLEQVFLNIISNARDALDMQHSNKELIIRSFYRAKNGTPGEIIISFTDTGPGIPPEIKYKIFDPFFSTKAVGRGTGLGLSLCFGIVEKHAGRIELDSEIGKGATFRVILPAISSNLNLNKEEKNGKEDISS
ncbi:MAG: PAS domain S-box protein [Thermodesulfobacteriota bacterium]|jgi:PAS domain S-box-containing protein|nr:MAG: PAS domain S-box protein [Thermodesulfobacteriota bacterium]